MDFETCFRQSRYLLLEGALGERLKREYGLKIDGPAAIAPLITQPAGRAALRELWGQYRAVARRHRLPFLATTPTRRANRERTALAGYDAQLLRESVAFLREVREQTGGTEGMYIGALMGCRGDAYLGDAAPASSSSAPSVVTLCTGKGISFLGGGYFCRGRGGIPLCRDHARSARGNWNGAGYGADWPSLYHKFYDPKKWKADRRHAHQPGNCGGGCLGRSPPALLL